MVDLTKIRKQGKTVLIATRIPEVYIKKLKKAGITPTEFVRASFEETFGVINIKYTR